MKLLNFVKATVASLALLLVGCDAAQEFTSVTQSSVAIEDVESPTSSTVTAKFVPNESCAEFFYAIGKSSDREMFLGQMLEGITHVDGNEPLEVTFEGLESDTEYTIFACGVSVDGEQGSLASFIVQSYDVECEVDTVYVGVESAAFSVSVNSAVYRMDYYFGESGLSEEFANDAIDGVEYVIEKTYKCCNYYDLEPNTSYSFYAKSYGRRGDVTDVVEIPITTSSYDALPSVEFVVGESDVFRSNFEIKPNDLCSQYYLLAGEVGSYSQIYDNPDGFAGNVYEMIKGWSGEDWGVYTLSGDHEFSMDNYSLSSTISYEFYIMACDKDNNPVALQRFEVTPELAEPMGKAAVELEVKELTSSSASFTITPNEHTVGVLFQTFTKKSYDGYWAYDESELYAWQLYQWSTAMANNSTDIPWNYGSEPFVYSEKSIAPGEYYVVVTAVNNAGVDNGGWGDIQVFPFEIVK